MIQKIKNDLPGDNTKDTGFLEADMEKLFLERAALIYQLVVNMPYSTPALLAGISTLDVNV